MNLPEAASRLRTLAEKSPLYRSRPDEFVMDKTDKEAVAFAAAFLGVFAESIEEDTDT